jgi:hypothetical protein
MSERAKGIFLSYASQDTGAAGRICDALRSLGLEVWFDSSQLRGGEAWDASVREQIQECALFVPIISAITNARSEGYFRMEWQLAIDRSHLMADKQTFLVPVLIDDFPEAAARVPDRFRERPWLRLLAGDSPAVMAERVRQLLFDAAVPKFLAASSSLRPTTKRADDASAAAIVRRDVLGFAQRLATRKRLWTALAVIAAIVVLLLGLEYY